MAAGGGGEMIKSVVWGEVHESAALTRHLPIVSVRVTPDSLQERFSMNSLFASSFTYSFQIFALTMF